MPGWVKRLLGIESLSTLGFIVIPVVRTEICLLHILRAMRVEVQKAVGWSLVES